MTRKHAPYIHDLVELARVAKVKLNKENIKLFEIITSFNIAARYPDYKFGFYKRCTKSYTERYFLKCKRIYQWLKQLVKVK